VPNLKGAQNAIDAGTHQLGVVMSVSEAHNKANINRTVEESLEGFRQIVEYRNEVDPECKMVISGGLATSFGCTITGVVPVRDVINRAERLLESGADRLNVADTVGFANPKQVKELFEELFRTVGKDVPVGAHFHDTRGLGLANAFAAVEAGVRELDACLGGLGGCPYAPGASGNVVTEDLVFMLEAMGMKTGIDLDALLETRELMASHLKGEPTQGTFVKAGPPLGFVPATAA
jgi:hydroxymethylglutaryl-CoA lyase